MATRDGASQIRGPEKRLGTAESLAIYNGPMPDESDCYMILENGRGEPANVSSENQTLAIFSPGDPSSRIFGKPSWSLTHNDAKHDSDREDDIEGEN